MSKVKIYLSKTASTKVMDVEAALELAKRLIVAQTGKPLDDLPTTILRGALQGKPLSEIAVSCSCNESYAKEVSSKLCKLLSTALGEPVTKRNLRWTLERRLHLEKQGLGKEQEIKANFNLGGSTNINLVRLKFSIIYPEKMPSDKWHSLYFFMYSQKLSEVVKRKINRLISGIKGSGSSDYESISLKFPNLIPEGSLIEISFFSEEAIKINPEKISFKWFEDLHEFHFRIKYQESDKLNINEHLNLLADIDLHINISVNTLPIISIPLTITISDTHIPMISTIDFNWIENIFASYSEVDYEVVEDFKEKYKVLGISMFTEAIHYRNAGVRDEALKQLFNIIESSDIFQLFWSSSAQLCEGVKRESAKAIELIQNGKKPSFFKGVYWEERCPALPDEMAGMQFYKLPCLRSHRKEKADLMKAIEREAARPIANITNTAIAESKSASDSFNIDQSNAVTPSTAIVKDQAKQQLNITTNHAQG